MRRNCLESWFSPALPALWHVILAIVPHPISPKFKFFPSPVWLVWKIASFKNGHHSIYPISHAFLKNSCWFSSLWGMCLHSIFLNLAWPVTMMGLYSDTVWLLRLSNKRWDIEFASFSWVSPSENTALFLCGYSGLVERWCIDVPTHSQGEVSIHNQHQLPDMWGRLYDDSSPNHYPAATAGETLVRTRQPDNCPHILAVVQSLSHIWLFATPLTAIRQISLSFTVSQSLLKLMSIESVMPLNHLILCHRFLLLPSIFPTSTGDHNKMIVLFLSP